MSLIDMSTTLNHLLNLHQEQICYVQCGFCTTVLLVSVPYSYLSTVVTVKCGHCTSLLSVNMMRSAFLPLRIFSSPLDNNQQEPRMEACKEDEEIVATTQLVVPLSKHSSSSSPLISSSSSSDETNDDDDDLQVLNHVVNKPPQKRQRAPSAYNRFIKEEIRRLKIQNPNMSHKQAFSTAAKNWAHSPPISQQMSEEGEKSRDSDDDESAEV
uniref:axial regulator YABBY 4 n=1 Tax=Erigeron canadensis TaxID=72917 RepID=UPI001CB91569|nr:axial regulator YABBY 4 [Erigeron canadensis]